jgi:hypothetical protein
MPSITDIEVGNTGTIPSTMITINHVESIVQKRLNIKWVDAKRLVRDAMHNCELLSKQQQQHSNNEIPTHRQDEVIEEACEIFADLTSDEQDQMRLNTTTATTDNDIDDTEPEWKRKARIQAERREAEWQVQQTVQQNQAHITTLLREKQSTIPEHEIPLTTIKSIRTIANDNNMGHSIHKQQQLPLQESAPIVRVKTTTCYCIIQ